MALPTYLELVNEVLVRLREEEVSTVDENNLSRLIGVFVNDAKKTVENAYSWNALTNTLSLAATAGTYNYVMTDAGSRFRVTDAYNVTSKLQMLPKSNREMNSLFAIGDALTSTGTPAYFNFNGVDSNGDSKVDLYPVPDGSYTIYFNIIDPQEKLDSDADALLVPSEPVIHLATAMARVERGEDGSLTSSEAYMVYKNVLADAVALEAARYPGENDWEAT